MYPPFGKQLAEDGETLIDDAEEQSMLRLIQAVKDSGFRFCPELDKYRRKDAADKSLSVATGEVSPLDGL